MNILCRTSKISYFYADLLDTWSELRYVDMFKVYNIKNETLWNHSNITYGNHTLFFKAWEKVGICPGTSCIRSRVLEECWGHLSNLWIT